MLALLSVLTLFLLVFIVGFWSLHLYPRLRPFRYSHHTEPQLPVSSTTSQLRTLAQLYDLHAIIDDCSSDAERVDALLRWTHEQWEPQPGRASGTSNPLDILARAGRGERFDRADYVTVLANALQAVDLPTRLIELHTRDSHWRPLGGDYRGLEVFFRDQHRWVWVDAQYDAVILNNGTYCNALDIKHALLDWNNGLELKSAEGITDIDSYLGFLGHYLDIVIAQPLGQSRRFALVPPQLRFPRRHHGFGRYLYDQQCHSRAVFYASHPIPQIVPILTHPTAVRLRSISA